jgi:hypothetical protein
VEVGGFVTGEVPVGLVADELDVLEVPLGLLLQPTPTAASNRSETARVSAHRRLPGLTRSDLDI